MWLSDVAKAVEAVKASRENFCIDKILPCWDGGIVFYITHHTVIKWFPDGTIIERGREDWRKRK